jgi:hypothetical protein
MKKRPARKLSHLKDRARHGRPAVSTSSKRVPEGHHKAAGYHRAGEKTKGQSALAAAVAEDELEERRRLFAKARKGDKGAVAKIYELYGARIYTSAQVKEVKPAPFIAQVAPFRKRAQRA